MIRWTPQGVVAYPRAVQIRLCLNHPQRIPGKAPSPSRTMTAEELEANLRHFTIGLDGPRSRPCTSLILSGMTPDFVAYTADNIAHFSELGYAQLVLHLAPDFTEATRQIQSTPKLHIRKICSLTSPQAFETILTQKTDDLELSIALNAVILEAWPLVLELLTHWTGPVLSLHYPYPSQDAPSRHSLSEIQQLLKAILNKYPDRRIHLKGLPICYIHPLAFPFRQTGNRWYVDADHQEEDALLFLPDVLQFYKTDACRFCPVDNQCDGFFLEHLQRGSFPPLHPPS